MLPGGLQLVGVERAARGTPHRAGAIGGQDDLGRQGHVLLKVTFERPGHALVLDGDVQLMRYTVDKFIDPAK